MARNRASEKPRASAARAEPQGSDKPTATRSSKAVRTRQRLVEAAKEIFEEHGFLEARISDIAERAGQSHGTFYYYFDSKEEVFREAAAATDEQLFAPLEDVIKARSPLAPQQRIREAMRRHFESYRREARIMGLIEHVSRYDSQVKPCASPVIGATPSRSRRRSGSCSAASSPTRNSIPWWPLRRSAPSPTGRGDVARARSERLHARARDRAGVADLRKRASAPGAAAQGLSRAPASWLAAVGGERHEQWLCVLDAAAHRGRPERAAPLSRA
jgi:AcrR family transcriptional regulator